ncbi:P-loop containing nucleoside triphosphate hydrolase protein [Epithele typhae]|uniref:P-loop containing nucleoside triphosphate hydrolase protein n=1 Tax=Epithele typhae TaxID=378194 RepID=UPI002007CBEF|nr:P-loop containing nucleoside triphosphate hydrolase protein [Epithele typhae]KAH9916715.1 P-loop containing nucleoside triphosphate hydrolase protein [Epithele typhae]
MGDNRSAKIDAVEKRHEESYELLRQARAAAKKKSKYNSADTRKKMYEECKRRTGFEPKKEQLDIAESMLLGLDSTVMAGTGWGKTLPFALPLFVRQRKIVIVISPLNVLEADQAKKFSSWGLRAVALNSESKEGMTAMLEEVKKNKFDIIVVGPKLCLDPEGAFRPLLSDPSFSKRILAVIVDEAHCIAQWGDSFRPEYSQLEALRGFMGIDVPVHATSATLTPTSLEKTRRALHIREDRSFHLNLGNDRPNIAWEVRKMNAAKSDLESLDFVLGSEPLDEVERFRRSIIFFDDVMLSLQAVQRLRDKVPKHLKSRICAYNSQRGPVSKRLVFKLFQRGDIDILIATEAAGMGFDAADIWLVIQFMVPSSLEVWLQRAGRAGRGKDICARAILLVQPTVFQEKGKMTRQPGDTVKYMKEIGEDLRDWITAPESECRRTVADRVFNNPPREDGAISGDRDLSVRTSENEIPVDTGDVSHSADTTDAQAIAVESAGEVAAELRDWRSVVPVTRSPEDVKEAVSLLRNWRTRTWLSEHSLARFGEAGIFPDAILQSLAARTTYLSVDDLASLGWSSSMTWIDVGQTMFLKLKRGGRQRRGG